MKLQPLQRELLRHILGLRDPDKVRTPNQFKVDHRYVYWNHLAALEDHGFLTSKPANDAYMVFSVTEKGKLALNGIEVVSTA